jgi:hypothetical protein
MKAGCKVSRWMPIQPLNQSVATRKWQRRDLTQQKKEQKATIRSCFFVGEMKLFYHT